MSDAPTRSTSHPSGRRLLGGALATGLLLLALPGARGGAVSAAAPYDWPQFNGDAAHSGNNTAESTLTASNVSGLTRLFHATFPATADGAPAYLNAVAIPGGTKDLVYVTTRDGYIVALDAHTGATVWSHQNGPGTCHINTTSSASGTPCYTTSSPAIDPNRQYVYSYGLDGYAHKYAVGDGAEIKTGGWPEVTTLKGIDEKGSSALTVAMAQSGVSYLYVTHGGYPGDNGDYQGHVTSINLADGSQKVFNANCSNLTIHFVEGGATSGSSQNDCSQRQTAIWARAGVVYDRDTDKIYMATGNGAFDAANNSPGNDWGDTVFALHPDGTGSGVNGNPLDSYTPSNYQDLQNGDTDIGSTAPAILPVPTTSAVRRLAVQSGKDSKLRLLNLDNLSGQGGPRHLGGEVGPIINVPQGGEVLSAPAVWVDPQGNTWIFVVNGNGISGLKLTIGTGGTPSLVTQWQQSGGGFSPLVANGVLYYAGSSNLRALDPTSGSQLWHDMGIGGIHWESPIVANGVLYITDNSNTLSAYALPATSVTGTPGPAGTATRTAVAATGTATTPPATATKTALPATSTATPPSATGTATTRPVTSIPSATATSAPTKAPTATATVTAMATATNTGTSAPTQTGTPTNTATASATGTGTATTAPTQTGTATNTATASATSTATGTATASATAKATATRTAPPPIKCKRKPSISVSVPHGIVIGNGNVDVRVVTEPRTTISVTLQLTRSSVIVIVIRDRDVPAPRHGLAHASARSHGVSHQGPRVRKVTKTIVLYSATVTARTGADGAVTARIHIAYNPRRSTSATLTVTAHTPCGRPRRDAHVVVAPAPAHAKPAHAPAKPAHGQV